ncbi:MAG: glycosyltransferase [Chloroflexota bacterium]
MSKKIAFISEHASPLAVLGGVDSGGQNVYVGQVARHLAALGYHVDVFTRRDDPTLPEIVPWADGARVVHIPAGPAAFVRKENMLPYMDEFALGMLRFTHREGICYDLAHANFWMSGKVAMILKAQIGLPFVVTFHALGRERRRHQKEADQFPDERFLIEEQVMEAADLIVAECPQNRKDLIELYGAEPARIVVVPAGYDPQEFAPLDKLAARRKLGLSPDERIILQLGRMVPRKGVDDVIRAFGRLVERNNGGPPLRLLVVGGESEQPDPAQTPEIGRLQAIARQAGVFDRVTFTGRRPRDVLGEYYSAADVFVSMPWYETFGMTPVEAMGCARPVVGSNVGGIKYTVVDGETGYLVPPRDPDTLASRLEQLLASPVLMERLGQNGLERARSRFSWETVARSLDECYEGLFPQGAPETVRLPDDLDALDTAFRAANRALADTWACLQASIVTTARRIGETLAAGGKVLICGNGGSAAQAQHLAAELMGRFRLARRQALPAIALTADTALLTAWANDVDYTQVFARQVEALAQPGDLLLGLSTSGRSPNVINAFWAAQARGVACIALVGADGGDLIHLADQALRVPSLDTARIQELHLLIVHIWCELIEAQLQATAVMKPAAVQPAVRSGYASYPETLPIPVRSQFIPTGRPKKET